MGVVNKRLDCYRVNYSSAVIHSPHSSGRICFPREYCFPFIQIIWFVHWSMHRSGMSRNCKWSLQFELLSRAPLVCHKNGMFHVALTPHTQAHVKKIWLIHQSQVTGAKPWEGWPSPARSQSGAMLLQGNCYAQRTRKKNVFSRSHRGLRCFITQHCYLT